MLTMLTKVHQLLLHHSGTNNKRERFHAAIANAIEIWQNKENGRSSTGILKDALIDKGEYSLC